MKLFRRPRSSKARSDGETTISRRVLLAAGIAVPATAAGFVTTNEDRAAPKAARKLEETLTMKIRRAHERGQADHGWLRSQHTFSFADYHDPAHMGFRTLRVINEDRVQPAQGFGTHPHRDMEILSYVLDGGLQHRDSMGNGSVIRPGEVQRMSAGTGVTHSEFNASSEQTVHFLQIWIRPEKTGITPGYEQKAVPLDARKGDLVLIASREGREGSVTIHQDAAVYAGRFGEGQATRVEAKPGRALWIQVARGAFAVGDEVLRAGDGAAIEQAGTLELRAREESEVIVFDLA